MSYLHRLFLLIVLERASPVLGDGESLRNLGDGDILGPSSEIDKGKAKSEIMCRDGTPQGDHSPGNEMSREDYTDFFSGVPALLCLFGDGTSAELLESRDIGTVALVPVASTVKSALLIGVSAVKLLLLKALALATASLAVSVLLIFNASRDPSKNVRPSSQYPENEPDLSGYGYTRVLSEWKVRDVTRNTSLARDG